jgi:flagellar biosynthesis component FlhA
MKRVFFFAMWFQNAWMLLTPIPEELRDIWTKQGNLARTGVAEGFILCRWLFLTSGVLCTLGCLTPMPVAKYPLCIVGALLFARTTYILKIQDDYMQQIEEAMKEEQRKLKD